MDKLQSKLNNFVKVRTIPAVLNALLQELEDDNSSVKSIAALIGKDLALTARVLRAANAAFYGRSSEITTVEAAAHLIGTRAIKALALSVSFFDIVRQSGKIDQFDLKDFWRHNLETAVISDRLAAAMGTAPLAREEAFVCGLLHDLGILFFVQEYPVEYMKLLPTVKSGRLLVESEKQVFGMSHDEIGGRIARMWRLPETIVTSIANHHQQLPTDNGSGTLQPWQIVNIAHVFVHGGIDVDAEPSSDRIKQRIKLAELAGIDPGGLTEIIKGVPNEVLDAASFLDIDIGDPLALLKRANDELGFLYEEYEKTMVENAGLQASLAEQEKNRIALEALRTTLATFSHYVNNATAAIIGRAQILGLYLNQGKLDDPEGKIAESMRIISESVDVISAVLEELKEYPEYKTVTYHGHSNILDIDKKIKARLGRLA